MDQLLDADGLQRLEAYFAALGELLGDARRKASFAMYCIGLILDGERKSMEPIAARLAGGPRETERAHDRIQHLISDGKWSDRKVRQYAAQKGIEALTATGPVQAWIIDDTGFLKQGSHSVGVQRQYTGSAGKTTNCQIGVSLTVATAREHLPVDFELYLPECWTNDPARRDEAKIPSEVPFRTKIELAQVMIDRAIEDGVPKGAVLVDSAYGDSSSFRRFLRERGFEYGVGVKSGTKVWRVDSKGRRRGVPITIGELARSLPLRRFRRYTWRDGTRRKLHSRFAFERVVPFHDDGTDPAHREDVWLVIEWPEGESEPADYWFSTAPRTTAKKHLVRTLKERYRTERTYEDLKGELGLDHFEGRSYAGWHHHVSCVLACNAFIQSERLRRAPPSAVWAHLAESLGIQTRAPLPRFVHHRQAGHRAGHVHVDAAVPHVPPMQRSRARVRADRESLARRCG